MAEENKQKSADNLYSEGLATQVAARAGQYFF
jgi:hypothetical protein